MENSSAVRNWRLTLLTLLWFASSLSAQETNQILPERTPQEIMELLKPTRTDKCEYVGGVPLGGLGAGTVELRGDGSFREWQIFNNWGNTLFIHWPQRYPSFDLLNAFAAIKIDDQAYVLETHPSLNLPGVAKIQYEGWFPFSRLQYTLAEGSPVEVSLEAFGSYIPHDAKDSAIPAIGLSWHLKNTSAKTVQVSLTLSLVNPLGIDCREETSDNLIMAESTRGAEGVAVAALDDHAQSILGGGDDRASLQGFWEEFRQSQPTFVAKPQGQRFGQMVTMTLPPGEEKTERFVVGWYFPNQKENGVGKFVGHQYALWSTSATDSVNLLAKRFADLRTASLNWSETLRDSSWPEWVNHWLCNSQNTIAKFTWWTKEGRYLTYESPECANGSPVHIIDLADWPVLDAFPELDIWLLRQFAKNQYPSGQIPEQFNTGINEPSITIPSNRVLVDLAPKYLVEIYHRWRETGDRQFLDDTWPAAKKAILYNSHFDTMNLGVPSGPDFISTFDHWNDKYLFSYAASVELAGLRAAEELAKVEGDTDFAAQMQALYQKGLATMNDHLWNGEFYSMLADDKLQPNNLSFVESTYGDALARFVGLGPILPDDKSLSTLRAIANYNNKPTAWGLVISATKAGEMVEYAGDKRSQITTCHSIPAPIALIQQGDKNDLENGLRILRQIYAIGEKYPGGIWNLPHHVVAASGERNVDDFGHYMRDRAIWALLKVLNGWSYNGVDQTLDIGPLLNPEKCHGPWICTTAYGTLAQEVTPQSQMITLSTKEGFLILTQLNVRTRLDKVSTVTLTQDNTSVASSFSADGPTTRITLSSPLKLSTGSILEIKLTP